MVRDSDSNDDDGDNDDDGIVTKVLNNIRKQYQESIQENLYKKEQLY
jgi:membrane protein involved in colicin uptake